MSAPYRTIVADPPWPMGRPHGARTHSQKGRWAGYTEGNATDLPYSTMTLDAIKALPVEAMAEPDAHLYLWTVNKFLEETYSVARAWGFAPAILLTWGKTPMGLGMGGAFAQTTEHVLFARRGREIRKARADTTWWNWKRGAHSVKPAEFTETVEQVSPGPYLELFARRQRPGWDVWGNEVESTVELVA